MKYPGDVVATALSRVRAGTLPCSRPTQEFGGPGEGTSCDVCKYPIDPKEMEIEAVYPEFGHLRLHATCMTALKAACAQLHAQD